LDEIYRVRAVEREADRLYDQWRKYLEGHGEEDKYWDMVIESAKRFDENNNDCQISHYAGTVINARIAALNDEWRRIRT
jgi:hypothetical protein